ncbi:CGNR zinc finger domain-containing protein [Jiangella alkaliphila]|uniref:CGNR zinc finger domain-containing protein n=1 Tax=Jiangella alkaliphila TaxID=419479 RepID=UPI00069BCB96|nr:ABATE domain-containing protein [Jiangella alkaliphila]
MEVPVADAVALDPGPYAGTYKLIGGSPALDFANLVSYRGTAREHDWLRPASNVAAWARAAGLEVAADTADAASLRDLRELLARVFLAVADGGTPRAADVERIGTLAAGARAGRRLVFAEGAPAAHWAGRAPSLLGTLALDAAALLTSAPSLGRVTACDECRWVFLDTTRNHSRRWCDPADCGNRSRQRSHYRRHRGHPVDPAATG